MMTARGPTTRQLTVVAALLFLWPRPAWSHHGGVSLALGPGSPIETNSPLTLPQGGVAVSIRAEQVQWRTFSFQDPNNRTSSTFTNVGLSYGLTPYLTGSLFVPYTVKRQDGLADVSDIGDLRFQFSLGLNYDPTKGVALNRADDTAVTLEGSKKVYLGGFVSVTAPTGEHDNLRPGETEVDKSMQTGFGSPAFTVGLAAARNVVGSLSLTADTTYDVFTEADSYTYGGEFRFDLASVYEIYGKPEKFLSKVDGILELNLLEIAKDKASGESVTASGGTILYLSPGVRLSFPRASNANLGALVKLPVWKDLNAQSQQQGSEGLEEYRAIVTLSFFF
jgi:hypothetical protein